MGIEKMLDAEFCAKLVQSASVIIGHNVLITDETGYILASNDAGRVGSLHEASLGVLASGKKAYHDWNAASKLAGTRPGMTIPIFTDEKVIGTIGITGSPEEISRFALLIQQLSQLFLNFQSRQQTFVQMDYRKQSLLREIITFDPRARDAAVVYSGAYEMGFDLSLPRIAVLIEVLPGEKAEHTAETGTLFRSQMTQRLSALFPHSQDFVCMQSDAEFAVLATQSEGGQETFLEEILEKCRQLQVQMEDKQKIRVGIGSRANSVETLRVSYDNARFATRILHIRGAESQCLPIDDVVLEKLAVNLPDDVCDEIQTNVFAKIEHAKNREEIMQVIEFWCQMRFNFSQTAEALHIHKSTLVYRFRRIQELYGLDLYDFDKVMALYLLNVRCKLR